MSENSAHLLKLIKSEKPRSTEVRASCQSNGRHQTQCSLWPRSSVETWYSDKRIGHHAHHARGQQELHARSSYGAEAQSAVTQPEDNHQSDRIEECREGCCQWRPAISEPSKEKEIERNIDQEGEESDDHRSPGVVQRIERLNDDFDHRKGR